MNAKLERRIMQMRLKETNRVPRLHYHYNYYYYYND